MRFIIALLPILVSGAVAAAAADNDYDFLFEKDQAFVDIRVGAALQPIPAQYPVKVGIFPEFGGGTMHYTDHLDRSRATSFSYGIIGGDLHPVGAIYGLELVHTSTTQNVTERTQNGTAVAVGADASSLEYRTIGGNLILGIGWQITKQIHLELAGAAGAGGVDLGFSDRFATEHADGGGWYWNAGLRAGAYLTWRRFVIGARVESMTMEVRADTDWVDANTSTKARASGVAGCLEFGYQIR